MTKLFFDCEFTGLHQQTTLISIGFISECGKTFYAEYNDYNTEQITDNDWIQTNVINTLLYNNKSDGILQCNDTGSKIKLKGSKHFIKDELIIWLSQFEQTEIWSDTLAYDWMLFNNIFGTAFDIPKNVYYIPFDIATMFKLKNIDPDINREGFAFDDIPENAVKHNALWDAYVIKKCYNKLNKL